MASLLFLAVLITAISSAAAASSPNSTAFIRRSCVVTLYRHLCYNSLKPYATIINQNPSTLTAVAVNVSLAKIELVSSHAAALRRNNTGRVGAALQDCVDMLQSATDLTKQSAAEIQKLEPAAAARRPRFSWEASNVQTWMSAALTNEDSCIDGFQDAGDGSMPAAVKAFLGKVGRVEKYTSNALALFNALVDV